MSESTRREILVKALGLLPAGLAVVASANALAAGGAAAAAKAPAAAKTGGGAGGLKFVPETDATAKALKYVADATKAQRADRAGVAGKDQFCDNCQLYTKHADIDGKPAGKCMMIQGGSVAAKGWCASWVKKA